MPTEPVSSEHDKTHTLLIEALPQEFAPQELFSHLVDAVQDYAIFAIDPNGTILTWNRGAEWLEGYKAKEVIGKNFSMFYTPEDLARNHPQQELEAAANAGRYEEEGWRVRKDGSRFWANTVISAMRDRQGRLTGFSKVTRDLSERRSNEIKLLTANEVLEEAVRERTKELEAARLRLSELLEESRENEQRFRTLADSIPQLCSMADADGSLLWYNKRWYEFTGTTPEQVVGWGWQQAHDPEYLPLVMEKWRSSVASGQPFEMTFPLRAANGSFRWFLTRVLPIRNSHGNVVRWFGTNTDVDESRRHELALTKTTEDLRRLIEARDDFLSIASHELKTPLTSIKLQNQLLKLDVYRSQGPIPAEKLRPVTELFDRQIERLLRLIEDMLDISRIRSGRLSMQREDVELCGLAKDVVERMKPQFSTAGTPAPVLELSCPVYGNWDRMRVEQVLNNLLSNAIKYGNQKQATVRVTEADGRCRISICDQGIGISEEDTHRIFQRFERAVDAKNYSGLGLGLFITRQIVLAHGGDVSVESELGQGSTFIVELPTIPAPVANSETKIENPS